LYSRIVHIYQAVNFTPTSNERRKLKSGRSKSSNIVDCDGQHRNVNYREQPVRDVEVAAEVGESVHLPRRQLLHGVVSGLTTPPHRVSMATAIQERLELVFASPSRIFIKALPLYG
jgi:hypothetical protein